MPKHIKSRKKKIGSAPGTLIHIGEHVSEDIRIDLIEYNQDHFNKTSISNIEEAFHQNIEHSIRWLDIDGLYDINLVKKIGENFKIHPLILEDILNTGQHPKIDLENDYIYIVLKMLYYDKSTKEIKSEQVSFVLFKDCLISFQEFPGDVFDDIRNRLENNKNNIRAKGSDYLLYSLIDAIVDSYFNIFENMGEVLDEIEDNLMNTPNKSLLSHIYDLKRDIIFLRNSIWPLREIVSSLIKDEHALFNEKTTIYLRDVYDHTVQIMSIVETYRDILSGMLDIYLSSMSNRTNEVMKVLTVFSTIFIPLSFLTGVYGMNFNYMPELSFKYGYPIFWGITIVLILYMINYFRKKNWF